MKFIGYLKDTKVGKLLAQWWNKGDEVDRFLSIKTWNCDYELLTLKKSFDYIEDIQLPTLQIYDRFQRSKD